MEGKTGIEKSVSNGEAIVRVGWSNHSSSHGSSSSSFSKPSWLLLTIADLDERMKMLRVNNIPKQVNADSFAKRAEAYYQQRPQLLTLLQDMYNAYLSLADRYNQALSKNHHRRRFSSPISPLYFDQCEQFDGEDSTVTVNDHSDAESSLSYNQPIIQAKLDPDMLMADLVIKNVDYDIIVHELSVVESRNNESSRKIELQKSLLEVLESERFILLSENATLSYRLNALVEENSELVSESLYMRRKAGELARCVLKMREDQRVFMLSRKIEDLQGQVYALEKKNKEYYEKLNFKEISNTSNWKKSHKSNAPSPGVGKKASKLWDKMKNLDIFLCGPHFNPDYC